MSCAEMGRVLMAVLQSLRDEELAHRAWSATVLEKTEHGLEGEDEGED